MIRVPWRVLGGVRMDAYADVSYFLEIYGEFEDLGEDTLAAYLEDASVYVRDLKRIDVEEDTLASITRDVAARMIKDRWRAGVQNRTWGATPFQGPNTDSSELASPNLGTKYLTQWDQVRLGIDRQELECMDVFQEPASWQA